MPGGPIDAVTATVVAGAGAAGPRDLPRNLARPRRSALDDRVGSCAERPERDCPDPVWSVSGWLAPAWPEPAWPEPAWPEPGWLAPAWPAPGCAAAATADPDLAEPALPAADLPDRDLLDLLDRD
jgi:hypothetical protein